MAIPLVRIKEESEVGLGREVLPYEDGLRTKPRRGSYEWWYFDSKYPDGSSLVIVFFTKPVTSQRGKFTPYVSLDYIGPDGKEIHAEAHSKSFSFSSECCDVRIGECYVRGNLNEYEIYFKSDEAEAHLFLSSTVRAWRPYSGHLYFGERDYFAWLPAVPEGKINGSLKCRGEEISLAGTGYHDHNWGNKLMIFLMNDWYWGRAKVGDYVIVSSYIYAGKKYGYMATPIFMLAKDGEILCDDAYSYLEFYEGDYTVDPYTKRHVANTLIYEYDNPMAQYRVTYKKGDEEIDRKVMRDIVGGFAAGIFYVLGFRGSYHRMGGSCTVEHLDGDKVIETCTAPAMWEQMCFKPDRIK